MNTTRRLIWPWLLPLIVLISGVFSSAIYWWNRGSLWEDEIIAITHGLEPLPDFFVEVLRNDIHPFGYFLLLKSWTALDIGSDSWALASSLISALFSAGALWYVTFRTYGSRAALWATALFCVLPTSVAAAANLRMYGLMPGVAVLCWYANREFLRTGRNRWIPGLVLLQLLQTYTHAIGFFFCAFFALSALIEQWNNADRRRLLIWGAWQAVSLILMLPVVASTLARGSEALQVPSLLNLPSFPAELIAGGQVFDFPYALAFGSAVFFLLLAISVQHKMGRIPALVITCGALLVCILMGCLGKPMFKAPVYAANLMPFLALGAGVAISSSASSLVKIVGSCCAVVLSVSTVLWVHDNHLSGNYEPTAAYIKAHAKPGDVVVVPNVSVFWGVMRYAVSPNWGHPLTTLPMLSNPAWTKMKNKLGPRMVQLLKLNPKVDHVDDEGIRYVIGNESNDYTKDAAHVWMVNRLGYKETVHFGTPMSIEQVTWFGKELSATRLHPDISGESLVTSPNP